MGLRFEIVGEALKAYLKDFSYYPTRHECCGITATVSRGVLKVVEEYKDVVNSYIHAIADEKLVSGSYGVACAMHVR